MKKKVSLVFATLVFVMLAAFLAVEGAEAFCIYNKADISIIVDQTSGGDFRKPISMGDSECCNWQNKSCNEGGKKDSIVKFNVTDMNKGVFFTGGICKDFPIKAGGWLTVRGSGGNYTCEAHYQE
jgi:hypothetical protein